MLRVGAWGLWLTRQRTKGVTPLARSIFHLAWSSGFLVTLLQIATLVVYYCSYVLLSICYPSTISTSQQLVVDRLSANLHSQDIRPDDARVHHGASHGSQAPRGSRGRDDAPPTEFTLAVDIPTTTHLPRTRLRLTLYKARGRRSRHDRRHRGQQPLLPA